jgi:hypothetical protein
MDAALPRHGGRQQLLDRSRKPFEHDWVMREQAGNLDVEDEAGWGGRRDRDLVEQAHAEDRSPESQVVVRSVPRYIRCAPAGARPPR